MSDAKSYSDTDSTFPYEKLLSQPPKGSLNYEQFKKCLANRSDQTLVLMYEVVPWYFYDDARRGEIAGVLVCEIDIIGFGDTRVNPSVYVNKHPYEWFSYRNVRRIYYMNAGIVVSDPVWSKDWCHGHILCSSLLDWNVTRRNRYNNNYMFSDFESASEYAKSLIS